MLNIHNQILEIISNASGIPEADINIEDDIYDQIGLDSFQLMSIVSKTEKKFNIDLPMSIREVRCARDFIQIVETILHK